MVFGPLDEIDRQLAHALQVDGRASFSAIAAVLGTTDRTIARRYRRLREAGVLRVVGLPDAATVGHVDWLIRMRCSPDDAVPVAKALARRPDTSWVRLLSGGTEINCITQTRQQAEEGELLLQKLPRSPRITAVTAHCILRAVAGVEGWPGRVAALDAAQQAALAPPPATASRERVTLTADDNRLLEVLARDGRTGYPALAAATGWSLTTVRRRLDDLRRSNALYFDVEIDPARLGYTAEAALWLTVEPSALTEVGDALATHPEVGYAAAVTGPANISANVVCRDLGALYDYLATGIGSLRGVARSELAPLVRQIKGAGTVLIP